MDLKQAGGSLDALISSFNTRIVELQELVIGRNMYAVNSIADLSEIDTAVKAMEYQMQSIKDRLREETEAIPKAKKLVEMSLRQQNKLQSMLAHIPVRLPTSTSMAVSDKTSNNGLMQEISSHNHGFGSLKLEEESAPPQMQKEKKSRASAPLWYVTAEELDSLSSYMRGRLTLDKVNAAINDMAAYAEANAQLISAPRNKLAENALEKALERRDIAMNEAVKGKHFFIETDIKGPVLKLDITGKSILTVLRHLGRINETRVGHQRPLCVNEVHVTCIENEEIVQLARQRLEGVSLYLTKGLADQDFLIQIVCLLGFLMFVTGMLVNGPYALITTAVSADLGTHSSLKGNSRALATITAIIEGTESVGAVVGPLFTGYISVKSWSAVFVMLMIAALVAGLLLTRLVVAEVAGRMETSSSQPSSFSRSTIEGPEV